MIRERPELELVGQASDGRAALAAIGSRRPDVAVIDRTLTGLSGEQILNAYREVRDHLLGLIESRLVEHRGSL